MARKTIALKGAGVRSEALANAGITPGMLVELLSTGKIQKHGTAGGSGVEKAFALEDELQGKEITDAYTTNTLVQYAIFSPGDVVNALLADGENAAIGSKLESNGDGKLRVVDADTSAGTIKVQSIVGVALEAVDMTGSAGEDPTGRIAVRIL